MSVRRTLMLVAVAGTVLTLTAAPVQAGGGSEAAAEAFGQRLAQEVTRAGVWRHVTALQRNADANEGNRASGFSGYDASAGYVTRVLTRAGLRVTHQEFTFLDFEQTAPTQLSRLSPQPREYVPETEVLTLTFSGSGEVTGQVQPVDVTIPATPAPSSTSGCEAADFVGFTAGNIALVQRGTCPFLTKASNAIAAGATAVIVFNEGQEGRTEPYPGDLGEPVAVPVISISYADGVELYQLGQAEPVTVRLQTSAETPTRVTRNVFAETRRGRSDQVVMAGAHLDSVRDGPGINDNGSGTAALLEVAVSLADEHVRNQVRFAFWGAEELGLIGSDHYVAGLTGEQLADITLYLNFDMIGSPNWGRFVYDGDGSAGGEPGPDGSAQIEQLFTDYFTDADKPVQEVELGGRSDHAPFAAAGVPAGGLFTGAEGIKTEEQAALWGGTAGVAFDPCYHQACDTIENVDRTALARNADAVAFAVGRYARFSADIPAREPVPA